jgi:hypothetical protein
MENYSIQPSAQILNSSKKRSYCSFISSWAILTILTLNPQAVFAETYNLIFDSNCSSSGEKLKFSCKPKPSFYAQNTTIFLSHGKWLGMESESHQAFPLDLIKKDDYVLVFNYPVLYSGIATIVLIKKTGRFYMSEISYSETLNMQNVAIEGGRFVIN